MSEKEKPEAATGAEPITEVRRVDISLAAFSARVLPAPLVPLALLWTYYPALKAGPNKVATAVFRLCRRNRNPVPKIHRPNNPRKTAAYAIAFALLLALDIFSVFLAHGSINYGNLILNGMLLAFLAAQAQRHYALPADKLLALDPRKPVLFLRSFLDDRDAKLWGKGVLGKFRKRTIDEAIAHLASGIGPFVAIAEPGSRLHPLGAAKVHVSDGEWQSRVEDWAANAQLIVMVAAPTEGIRWELDHVFERDAHKRFILLIPRDLRLEPELAHAWLKETFAKSVYASAIEHIDLRSAIALVFLPDSILVVTTKRIRRSEVDYMIAFQTALFALIGSARDERKSASTPGQAMVIQEAPSKKERPVVVIGSRGFLDNRAIPVSGAEPVMEYAVMNWNKVPATIIAMSTFNGATSEGPLHEAVYDHNPDIFTNPIFAPDEVRWIRSQPSPREEGESAWQVTADGPTPVLKDGERYFFFVQIAYEGPRSDRHYRAQACWCWNDIERRFYEDDLGMRTWQEED